MESYKCNKEAEIATVQADIKTLFKNIDRSKQDIKDLNKIYDLIKELTVSVSVLAQQMKTNTDNIEFVKNDVSGVKKDIEEIKLKPANSFDHYKKLIAGGTITTLLGALIGALITQILM